MRLKANKTSLYNLVATYKPLPGMRRVDFQKANGRPDYWLEWTTDDGHTKAFLSSSLGHGEKSLYQIARFIRLEDHEALAIRWHMGAYDTAARTDLRDLSAAMDATPWVWRLHEADMCAAHIDERGTDE